MTWLAGHPPRAADRPSAFAGAAAAALVAMVARLTVGKKKYADVEPQMWHSIERADALRPELTAAIDEDAGAFQAYLTANRLPKDTPEQQAARDQAVEQADPRRHPRPVESGPQGRGGARAGRPGSAPVAT